MDAFANAMQAGIGTTGVSTAQVAAGEKDGDEVLSSLLAWRKALKALNLSHCAFWVNNPGQHTGQLGTAERIRQRAHHYASQPLLFAQFR